MFQLSKVVRRTVLISLLAGTTGLVLNIAGCGSQPGRVKITHNDPWTGHTEGEYIPDGPTTTLPAGWQPGGEDTVEIVIDGKRYRLRICVARNANNPNCIYVNLNGCNSREGWQMYCQVVSQQAYAPPSTMDDGPVVQVGPHKLRMTTRPTIDPVPPSDCPDEWGSVDHDIVTGVTTLSFTTACRDEVIPTDLYNVTITSPQGVSLPADVFSVVYNGIMPVGSVVEMQGDGNLVAWNCLQFHRPTLSFTSTDGHIVHAGIVFPQGAPPVAMLAIDGEIERVGVVTRPQ